MSDPDYLFTGIDVVGADANTLLQGQLCNDLQQLISHGVQLSGWINPAGRVITLIDVIRIVEGYRLFVPTDLADAVVNRLTLYRLRAKAEISKAPGIRCWASDTCSPSADHSRQLAAAGATEVFAASGASPPVDCLTAGQHHLQRLRSGIPLVRTGSTGKFTAHQLNLDRLEAISLSKGCYSGQEIVARTQHLGRVKRRLQRLVCKGLPEGDLRELDVTREGQKAGIIVDYAPDAEHDITELLAVLPVDSDARALRIDDRIEAEVAPLPFDQA